GRYIRIYYGSFQSVCGDLDDDDLYEELYATLSHEFTHHIESLAGERGLELKDEEFLQEYREEQE
ncbi:MAG: metallopeptidase family protein, partial [Oscillospiraceae bacterium]